MKHQLRGLAMIMEDVQGEQVGKQQEVEHVFYGKIADAHQLAELAKQPFVEKTLQEQCSGKLMGKGNEQGSTLRIRRVNHKDCVLTSKLFVPGQAGMQEETVECPGELFDFFSRTFGECLNKMRYTIKPEGWERALELDVFLDQHGHPNGYAKYDYEVTGQDQACPPLPVTLVDMKHLNPYNSTDADAALLREFMQSQAFRTA